MAKAEKSKPLIHRSSTDKKFYAIHDSKDRLKDIKAYLWAHKTDLKRKESE